VAKKKDSMALFEVISNQRDTSDGPNVSIPRWMGKPAEPELAQPVEAPVAEPVAPEPAAPVAKPPKPEPVKSRPAKPRTLAESAAAITFTAPAEPMVSVEDGRLKLSLGHVSAALGVAGVLVLLVVSFTLGRWTAGPRQPEPAAKGTEEQPLKPGQVPPMKASPLPKVTPRPQASLLETGKYYLVIQTMRGIKPAELSDARKIEKFCNDKGVPATVVTYTPRGRTPRYMVWSRKPFRLAETLGQEAGKHAELVENLGTQYFSAYGGYKFSQSRNPRGQVEGWFLKCEKK